MNYGCARNLKYDVKPGRLGDFMTKLQVAADPRFDSPVMPQSVRLFRSAVPGPDTGPVILMIEYADMAAYGVRKRPPGMENAVRVNSVTAGIECQTVFASYAADSGEIDLLSPMIFL